MRARVWCVLLMLGALAFPALAQSRGGVPSLDRVLPQIRRTTPGTFYDAEGPFFTPDGQAAYRIKWMMPDGRIIWFYADARTGRIMGMGGRLPPLDGRYRETYPGGHFRGWPPPDYGGGRDGGQGGGWGGGWGGSQGGGWNGGHGGQGGGHRGSGGGPHHGG